MKFMSNSDNNIQFYAFQIIDEDKKLRGLKIDSSHIDSSTESSNSYESIHLPIYQNCHDNSSNDCTSFTESSSNNSKSDFTQIENHQHNIHNPPDSHFAFDAKIVFVEKPRDSGITRSISIEPSTSKEKEPVKGRLSKL